ncbi:unnamed protein product [Prorocentrum cordatum]|uniref:Uncharacterized protein n=1 Tax=Prorocentrum cordatum TaxID=2364126 RepID=A0ABN9UKP0_9DINO|nr:unnamed protein product [Polarella glacialis]
MTTEDFTILTNHTTPCSCGQGSHRLCGATAEPRMCGWKCERGAPYANHLCQCCCQPNPTPSTTPSTTPSATPSLELGSTPSPNEVCERKGDGCEIESSDGGSPAECGGSSCCELFREALADLHQDGGNSDPNAEVSCGEVLEVVCSACEASAEAGSKWARLVMDGLALAGRGSSGAAAAAALATLGAAAVLGGRAAAALRRWGAAPAPAAASFALVRAG